MNLFDLAVLGFLGLSAGVGAWKGISKRGFGFLAVSLSFAAAAWLYPANQWGFWITFAIAVSASAAGAWLLGKWCKLTGMLWVDHALGGGIGMINGAIFCILSVLALLAFAPRPVREQVTASCTAPYAIEAALAIAELTPEPLKARVEAGYLEVQEKLPPPFRRVLKRLPPQVI